MFQSGSAVKVNARAVELASDALGEEQYREIQGVWSMSVCNSSVSQAREPGEHFLSMLVDCGSEEHVSSVADWKRLGEPSLNPFHVRSGWCRDQPAVLTALVAARATISLCSASKFPSTAYVFEMKPTLSTLYHEHDNSVLLQSNGKRYFLVIRMVKTSDEVWSRVPQK